MLERLNPFLQVLIMGPIAVVAVLSTLLVQAGDDARLEPGQVVERELLVGDQHRYSIVLDHAGAWRLSVEQRGVDVVVEVLSLNDEPLFAVDSPLDRRGEEAILLQSSAAVTYRVVVRGQESAAAVARYAIRLETLPDPVDPLRLVAEGAATEAARSYRRGADGYRQAISWYSQALEAWRQLGTERQIARSLFCLAVLHRLIDDTNQAIAIAEEASALWQRLDEPFFAAMTWNELGLNRRLAGELPAARLAFERALTLHLANGNLYGEAVARSNLCLMDFMQGELRAGVECSVTALELLRRLQATDLEGTAHLNVGRAYNVLGEPLLAIEHYQRALELQRSSDDRKGEASTLNNLAVLRRELGELDVALKLLDRALQIFDRLGDRRWQATVHNNLGLIYHDLGETGRARFYYERALDGWREVKDRAGEATTLSALGLVHGQQDGPQAALPFHRRALELRRALGDRRGEGIALIQLARAHRDLGELTPARERLKDAIELLHGVGDRINEATAERLRGMVLTEVGEQAVALESLQRARELGRATHHRFGEAEALYALAETKRSLGRRQEALNEIEAAVELLDALRTEISAPNLRAAFSGLQHKTYALQIELLGAAEKESPGQGFAELAFEASERAKARALLEVLYESGADLQRGVDPDLIARQRSLAQRSSAKADRLATLGGAPGAQSSELEAEQAEILRHLDVVAAEIRQQSPGYAELTQPVVLDTKAVRHLLDAETLMLSYFLGEERSFLWAVTVEGLRMFVLPPRGEIERAVLALHEQWSAPDVAARRDQARFVAELSQVLLGDVAPFLGDRRLLVVADGALHYLPFAALPEPTLRDGRREPLLARHEVVSLPSATVLAAQRTLLAGRPPASKQLAILADPVFDRRDGRLTTRVRHGEESSASPLAERSEAATRGFERLPGTRQEAIEIASLLPADESLVALDFDANRELVLSEALRSYRVVHFATHGMIDAEEPALSGLALSGLDAQGLPRDGFLRLPDVYELRLAADLVVLSGCRTALGKEVRGEGLIGLTRGFMYAGTPRVLASLWQVEDRATAALMVHFYRALWQDGLPAAAALRAAQLALSQERRWRDPYFWAAFVLQGDWR